MENDQLLELVRRIEKETGRAIPTPNPNGPLSRALALFVLRDPGATEESGANETGILDPYVNRDPTSSRQQAALQKANIDPRVCIWWNASPYHLGYKGPMRDGDCIMGSRYLGEVVKCCRDLRVVVALGPDAQTVAEVTRLEAEGNAEFPPSSQPHTR